MPVRFPHFLTRLFRKCSMYFRWSYSIQILQLFVEALYYLQGLICWPISKKQNPWFQNLKINWGALFWKSQKISYLNYQSQKQLLSNPCNNNPIFFWCFLIRRYPKFIIEHFCNLFLRSSIQSLDGFQPLILIYFLFYSLYNSVVLPAFANPSMIILYYYLEPSKLSHIL